MFPIERTEKILEHLRLHKSATVSELAKKLYIGEATIRRDLSKLQSEGFVDRIYGGVVLVEGLNSEIPLYIREKERKTEKDSIGRLAATLVEEGDIIIIDSSSTSFCMIDYLRGKRQLTAITNGAKTAVALGELHNIKVFSTGGRLREHSLSYIGNMAEHFMKNFYADKMFFSCRALSGEKGVLDSSEEEAELRQVMIKHAERIILLCDRAKINGTAFYKVCDIEEVDTIVTNRPLDDEIEKLAENKNIEVIAE